MVCEGIRVNELYGMCECICGNMYMPEYWNMLLIFLCVNMWFYEYEVV